MELPDLTSLAPWGALIVTLGGGLWRVSASIAKSTADNEARHQRNEAAFQEQIMRSNTRHSQHDSEIRQVADSVRAIAEAVSKKSEEAAADRAETKTRLDAHDHQIERMLTRLEQS